MRANFPTLRQLELKHRNLEQRIRKEEVRPSGDQEEIKRLKWLKLAVRHDVERYRLAQAGEVTPEPAA